MNFLRLITRTPITQNSNLQSLQFFSNGRVDPVAICKVHLDGVSLSSVCMLWWRQGRVWIISALLLHMEKLKRNSNSAYCYFDLTHRSLWQPFEAYRSICSPKQHPGLFVPAVRRHAGRQASLVAFMIHDNATEISNTGFKTYHRY